MELHTDASKYGYGAGLLQKSNEDGRFHPVYYMSKKTTPAEEKYSSYELEVLAIIQTVKKFRIYLLGIQFKIITDCSAFQKTMAKEDLTTRVTRWALLLEEYSYEIEHRKGNKMSHVDALSRHPNVMTITLTEEDCVVERLRRAQELDEHILAIKKILSTEDYEDFFVETDILYKFVNRRKLIVFPMQTDIIKKAHEIGHFALPKTEEMENRRTFNLRRRKPRLYKKGDLVAIERTHFGVGIKIQRKFLGPYEVTKMKPNDRYDVVKVGHHEGPLRTSTCAEFMVPWVDNQSESGSDSEQDGRV
ncbi:hypothetical protein JTB14_033256 [Gonioctena quinquepunctata]|nr:hypothetical protein JTB14_033256 [Gonioctena quinquepunctata]